MSRAQTTLRPTAMDRSRARSWTLSAFGPVAVDGPEAVRAALRGLAAAGPAGRIGGLPRPGARRWDFDPDRVEKAVRVIDPVADDDLPRLMEDLVRHRDPEEAVWVCLAGDRVLVYLDHGLGDGRLTLDLSNAVLTRTPQETPDWQVPRGARGAVGLALARALAANPRLPAAVVGDRVQARRAPTPEATEQREWVSRPGVGFARGTPETLAELTSYKDAHIPGVSTAALLMAVKTRALRAVGLDPHPTIHVLFDCRRYLPRTVSIPSNFAVGVDIALDDPGDPTQVAEGIARCAAQGRPAFALARTSVLTAAGLVGGPPSTVATSPRPRMAFSDLGRAPQLAALPWTGDEPGRVGYAAMVDTGAPDLITFTGGRLHAAVSDTVSFEADVFDPDTVRAALTLATTDPVGLLTRKDL